MGYISATENLNGGAYGGIQIFWGGMHVIMFISPIIKVAHSARSQLNFLKNCCNLGVLSVAMNNSYVQMNNNNNIFFCSLQIHRDFHPQNLAKSSLANYGNTGKTFEKRQSE